jgi:hypothetical protein
MFAGYFQIGEKLGLVNWEDPFYGFQFDDYFPFDDQVDLVPAVKLKAFVRNWECHLPFERQPTEK